MTEIKCQHLKACWNRCDLRLDLKSASDLAILQWSGSLFHRYGAAWEKALSPYFTVEVFGIESINLEFDLRHRSLLEMVSKSLIYCGANPWSALYVNNNILYWILWAIGNQWSLIRTGVMWSNFLLKETTRAAAFWIRCNLLIWYEGRPYRRLLKQSNLDDT